MKKLLSILAAVGLTATASTAVVACGNNTLNPNDGGITPVDGKVIQTFKATFANAPTQEDLKADFAVTDSKGNVVEGVTYTFTPDKNTKAMVLADDKDAKVAGIVTTIIPVDSIKSDGKTANLTIDTTPEGKKTVSGFTPVKVKVSVPENNETKLTLSADIFKDATTAQSAILAHLSSSQKQLLMTNISADTDDNICTSVIDKNDVTSDNIKNAWSGENPETMQPGHKLDKNNHLVGGNMGCIDFTTVYKNKNISTIYLVMTNQDWYPTKPGSDKITSVPTVTFTVTITR